MKIIKIREKLLQIRSLIDSPENWTKGCLARNKNDKCVYTFSKEACKWCLTGAIYCVVQFGENFDNNKNKIRNDIKFVLSKNISKEYSTIIKFNDHSKTTHKDVLNLLDKTIEELK